MSFVLEGEHVYMEIGISRLGCSLDDVLAAVEGCSHSDQIIVSFGLNCVDLRCL